ncbi:hypothetical protein [Rufibacter quisquiliarum]|uniref:Uncharacterized protein n=1 Tax=Rufibacter quisquiliarum TaxID=1549639 RepID=A0A839GPH2_9BACT|nr:hypothetical protein [Rufibacter quisquiliarum]MBA9079883.1 hypothetical protein [Rufibacter quisquiliarum]
MQTDGLRFRPHFPKSGQKRADKEKEESFDLRFRALFLKSDQKQKRGMRVATAKEQRHTTTAKRHLQPTAVAVV